MLQAVTIDFGPVDPRVSVRAMQPSKVVNNGWMTWAYGSRESAITPLNFQQNILFCPYPNSSGINTYMTYPLTATYKLYGRDGSGLSNKIGSQVLNLASGIIGALGQPKVFHGPSSSGSHQENDLIPYSDAPHHIKLTPATYRTQSPEGGTATHSTYRPLLVMLQMASEIAQWTIMRDTNEDVQPFTNITGYKLCNFPGGIVRYIDIDLTATPTQSAFKFGATGLYKAGYVAFEYNNFFSPLEYINQVSQRFFPPAPGATGVGVWITSPLMANANLYYFSDFQVAMDATLGQLGLMSGDLAAIL